MEEWVGQAWHRLVTALARDEHPDAAVELAAERQRLGILFRALGGDPGLELVAGTPTRMAGPRSWRQRLAGTGDRFELAWRDGRSLYLPSRLSLFPERELNRALYLWLTALAARDAPRGGGWFHRSQWLARRTLKRLPGLGPTYRRLLEAYLPLRPAPDDLPPDEAAVERAIRRALEHPGTQTGLPAARRPPAPVLLWLHPNPPTAAATAGAAPAEPGAGSGAPADGQRRYRARRRPARDSRRGLLLDRFENLLSFGERLDVDRTGEEADDADQARQVAEDLDEISVSDEAGRGLRGLVNFDLDLPSAAADDLPLGGPLAYPEWDWRHQVLRPAHCRVRPLIARDAHDQALPQRLRPVAARLRRQFRQLAPERVWLRAQPEGPDLDLDACLQHRADRLRGHAAAEADLYRAERSGFRDLACLLLADLSLSTDTWVNGEQRVIDVIQDALLLFGEALSASGDRFAIQGFSSRRREHVRMHYIKGFDEPWGDRVRGRVLATRPGFYTRMGAAIRHGTALLDRAPARRRLLLLLTDGKPNDLDHYEGRYGIEDTRQAIQEARGRGVLPFCVTIDAEGAGYLPHLFGSRGFVCIHDPVQLPRRLPQLYAAMTAR